MLPTAATVGRRRQLRVRAHRARAADAVLPGPDLAVPAAHPGDRGRPVRVHAGLRLSWSPPATSSSATSATSSRHVLRLWWFLSPGPVQPRRARRAEHLQGATRPCATLVGAQPVRDPVRGLPDGHLRDADADRRACPTSGRSAALLVASIVFLGAHDDRLQAPRAELREGHLMAVEQPPAADGHAARTTRSTPSDLGVRYDLRFTRRRPSAARSGRCSGAASATSSGRCATSTCTSSAASRWRSSARTARARARSSRSSPGSSGRPRASVDVRGHVSGLLTLGAGFDKELTGRDNILLGGAFLGLDDAVTRELLPSIIEYAELGDFIDAPLKTYSSGMRARLGFAIATSVDPDILLLDEVLATGDANFRAKSKARVIEIVGGGQGGRAGDPRHELGHRVLQPGDPHRARRAGDGGRAGGGRRAPSASTPRKRVPGPRRPRRRRASTRGSSGSAERGWPALRRATGAVSGGEGPPGTTDRRRRRTASAPRQSSERPDVAVDVAGR